MKIFQLFLFYFVNNKLGILCVQRQCLHSAWKPLFFHAEDFSWIGFLN